MTRLFTIRSEHDEPCFYTVPVDDYDGGVTDDGYVVERDRQAEADAALGQAIRAALPLPPFEIRRRADDLEDTGCSCAAVVYSAIADALEKEQQK